MNSLVNYVIQSGFCLLVFYAFYLIFLKKETCFQYNRAYLFFSSFLALILPLMDFYELFGISIWQQSGIIPAIYLPEIVLAAEGPENAAQGFEISLTGILAIVYLTGAVLFLTRFLIQILTIKRIIAKNQYNTKYWQGCYLINTQGKLPTFSFFKYLFWDNSIEFTQQEKTQILNHELIHIRQKHSYDIIYFEILGVLFWFNPLVGLYKKAMIDTHEFIADSQVIKTTNASHYGHLIVRQLFKHKKLAMGSYFNKSQAYRRINMIKMDGQKTRLYKLLISLPLAATLAVVMGFNIDQGQTSELIYRNLPQVLIEDTEDKPYQDLLYIEKSPGPSSQLSEIPEKLPDVRRIQGKDKDAGDLVLPRPEAVFKSPPPLEDEVFTLVEHQPGPVKGMKSFYTYIRKNLRYPSQARRMGIEGKVFLEFIVNKDGSLSNIRVLKGIGAGCDMEAKKVLQNAENWTPGRQNGAPVKVRMVIPITFSLS